MLGDEVRELENSIAEYCQTKHAIGCASGSDALLLALMALDIKAGDEVITTPFSVFCDRQRASPALGARPVFVDIDPRTYNLDRFASCRRDNVAHESRSCRSIFTGSARRWIRCSDLANVAAF